MLEKFNLFLDKVSEFLAHRKGLLPLIGAVLVLLNLLVVLAAGGSWLASSNLLLHLGIVVAILGFMLAWAL
ncbi:MAG: hypothetical protein Fur0018_26160 [Anaerolineales bacterium]